MAIAMPMQTDATNVPAPWIARQVRALLGHSGPWLLEGPAGLGQFDLALELARAWLCDHPTPDGACGRCASCHAIAVHTHPDLLVLMPEAHRDALGWPAADGSSLDGRKTKLSRDIRVAELRAAVEFAQRTSSRGKGKVVLVHPAERMNAVSANALLKTLEEPAVGLRFVLASAAAHRLLPTIRSRCLAHTMEWPDREEGVAWLRGHGTTAGAAEACWRVAGGSPEEALRLAEDQDALAAWGRIAAAARTGDEVAFAGVPTAELVARLQKLCHDLLLADLGAKPRFFTLEELGTPVHSRRALLRWWQALGRLARDAEHPLQADLTRAYALAVAEQTLNSGRH